MSTVRMSDVTLKQKAAQSLSFKEKIELVKLLNKLCVDTLELPAVEHAKADSLFIKSVCETARDCAVSVEVRADRDSIDQAWEALKNAEKPRLQVASSVSLVQMEYMYHKKPAAVKDAVTKAVAYAKTLTDDVEFLAVDATRSEREFLFDILSAAIEAGASTVSVCDTAGQMLPAEFDAFIRELKTQIPGISEVTLGVSLCDEIAMADACSMAAAIAGAGEIKASIYPENSASLKNLAVLLQKKGTEYGLNGNVRTVELKRLSEQAVRMFTTTRSKTSPFETGVRDTASDRFFTANDTMETIVRETKTLGYDLTEEDQIKVYEEFRRIAEKKDSVSDKEIDAIVASAALQVPAAYVINDFIINSCNQFSASAHIRLEKNGELMESVALGDGSVDAAFLAIEQIVGRHYELDDFQIQAVTRGREAMVETIVKLRSGGKVYSGRGLSTDIIGSSISAYVNALNKIVYEEENE